MNARRAWATGESKRFFWIYERFVCWCCGVIEASSRGDLPTLAWPWLGLLLSHRQPIRSQANSEYVKESDRERRQTRSYKIIDQRQDDGLYRCCIELLATQRTCRKLATYNILRSRRPDKKSSSRHRSSLCNVLCSKTEMVV